MVKRLMIGFIFCMFLLLVFAGGAYAASKAGKNADATWKRSIYKEAKVRGDEESVASFRDIKYPAYSSAGPVVYCEDAVPQMEEYPGEYVIRFDQIGSTWYDFQKNGSMGRMMSVTSDGYRHFSWMYAPEPYNTAGDVRFVYGNSMNPGGTYVGQQVVDGGTKESAGYSNQDHLKDGISVVIYHRTAAEQNQAIPYSMMAMEDVVGSGMFTRTFDIPDSFIVAPTFAGHWPKLAIKYDATDAKDYIHVVLTEGNTAAGVPCAVGYYRCYLLNDNTLVCQAPMRGAAANTYTLTSNISYSAPKNTVSHFDSSCSITPIVVCSPVSKRVALVSLPPACRPSCDAMTDVAYYESMNSGNDWMFAGNWPPAINNLTNYGCAYPEEYRAWNDASACYDYNDSLHIVWSTVGYPEPTYYQPGLARLWHWSKQWGSSMVTSAIWGGTEPGAHNSNLSKMSISTKDPIYHPGGVPDSVYLYTTWVQFDSGDVSNLGYSNAEIYGVASNDAGRTWGNVWNLTQTKTPDCLPGECVSEHWPTLATNMYDGQLHISYICDKDAGTSLSGQDGTTWLNNPVMYMNLKQWDIGTRCEGSATRIDPGSFHLPPVKVTPGGSRVLTLRITNVGNQDMPYTVIADDPDGCISGTYSSTLPVLQAIDLSFIVSGAGACENQFILGNIDLTMCDQTTSIPIHAISALDYYECPIDPVTYDTVETSALRLYANANSLEWIEDKGLEDPTLQLVFFQGGSFVATKIGDTKVVGRWYGDNDMRAGVRDRLYYDYCEYDIDPDCHILYTKNIFIFAPPDPPLYTDYTTWWWWEWSKVIKVCELPDNKKIVIKYIRVQRHDKPTWWPGTQVYAGHEDTYIGLMMDIDCPYDTLGTESARNLGGWDDVNKLAWQQGFYNALDPEGHPEYDNYYAGMALADPASTAPVTPYGTHIIKNNYYLYPQDPWGWLEDQFYDLAATAGTSIQDSDSLVDRSVVMTATQIPAGIDANADHSFVIIEAMTPNGLTDLQALIAEGRQIVVDEAAAPPEGHGIPIICGDANGKDGVNMGDAIYLLNYLFKGEAAPLCPMNRADVNSKDGVNMGDAIYLLNYLFKGDAPPVCPGIFF